jgi:hypothetical protein
MSDTEPQNTPSPCVAVLAAALLALAIMTPVAIVAAALLTLVVVWRI